MEQKPQAGPPQDEYANFHSASSEFSDNLKKEKDLVDQSLTAVHKLINEEIDRIEKGARYQAIHHDKRIKIVQRFAIPRKEFPKFNFVGKLLGPGGTTLKALQDQTGTRMSVLGRGSCRDKKKEDDLRDGVDPKYAHLKEDLHVLVEILSTPIDAYQRMAGAVAELQKYLIPNDNDEITQTQMAQMGFSPSDRGGMRGRGRGMPMRGRGGPRGRGMGPMGSPPARGGPRGRAPIGMRGRGAPGPGRGVPPVADGYGQSYKDDGYGYSAPPQQNYEDSAYSTPSATTYNTETGDTYNDPYSRRDVTGAGSYTTADDSYYGNSTAAATNYDSTEPAYEDYSTGSGAGAWSNGTSYKAAPARGKTDYRTHPYAGGVGAGSRGMAQSTARY